MPPSRSKHKRGLSTKSLFSQGSYDGEVAEYTSVATADDDYLRSHMEESEGDEEEEDAEDVLREEEEREKLLAGGSIFRHGGIKIGKKVRGQRRRKKAAGDVANMMGGKRLGMEEGGEFGLAEGESGDDGDEDEEMERMWGEVEEKKPRKPSLRKIAVFSSLLLSFLAVLIFASLVLSRHRNVDVVSRPLTLSNGTHLFAQTTVLISLDGLRADFLSRHLTPTLSSFINSGVSPPYMMPSFPSVTFPNHWTLVTGLYPESHGIVGNSFFDPNLQQEFYYTDPLRSLQHHWWGGEPIWRTLERQGGTAAVHMWPGSEAVGCGARMVDRFNSSEQMGRKVDRILGWLDLPAEHRPQLVAAYVPDVDIAGHKFGPNTTGTDDAIRRVDGMLHGLLLGLEERNLTEVVNIVVVSDHGMAGTDKARLLYLEDLVNPMLIEHTNGWPLYGLRPKKGVSVDALHDALKKKETEDGHWRVYTRDHTMPARYHFSNNPRIAPLWIVPDAGWAVVTEKEFPRDSKGEYHPKGLHGYDNEHPLMRAIFVARGPAFRHLHGEGREWLGIDRHSGVAETKGEVRAGRVKPFTNTEVYRLLCQSLGLVEAASNATMSALVLDDDDAATTEPLATNSSTTSSTTAPLSSTATKTSSPPSRPTKIVDPDVPAVTGIPQDIEVSAPGGAEEQDGEGKPGEKTWWELLKSKAERLKGKLEGWWRGVWVDGEEGPAEGAVEGGNREKGTVGVEAVEGER